MPDAIESWIRQGRILGLCSWLAVTVFGCGI
jgi:hypothetical protein